MVKFSIIIPTYNKFKELLRPCVESIIKFTDLSTVEILISANGCTDETKEYIESLGEPFKLVWSDEALGYTRAINLALPHATGDYIVLLNNDTILLEQSKNAWLTMLHEPFLEKGKYAVSGPLQLFDNYAGETVIIFFCAMIPRSIFDELGILDESYSPGGGEDIDFCVKAKLKGYELAVVPLKHATDFDQTKLINTGSFPIFHQGEGTFNDMEEYGKRIIKENGLKNLRKFNKHIRLNLGSGGVEIPGYISVDKNDTRASILMDVFDLDFEENSVEEIIASHLFEHVNPYRSVELLQKWFKVLKPGGKLIMEVPNIEELCRHFITANKQDRYGILNCIYGSVNTTETGEKDEITSPHLWGWYPEIMQDHLMWAGFTDIVMGPEQIPHPCYNFRVEATKPALEQKEEITNHFESNKIIQITTNEKEIEEKVSIEISEQPTISAVICTKDRYYSTLPLAIRSVCNQIYKPKELIIVDDGEQKDLRTEPIYANLFSMLVCNGIEYKVFFGQKRGQVFGHQGSIDFAVSDWIWRIDDDNMAQPDVLEKLIRNIQDDVGAVAGLVIDPKDPRILPPGIEWNRIDRVEEDPNIQWLLHPDKIVKEVEHLYSTFIFRKQAAKEMGGYCLELSPACHREETIFSHELYLNGWKLLVDPTAVTWHMRYGEGGIRSHTDQGFWAHDEQIFQKKKEEWKEKYKNRIPRKIGE